MDEFSTFADQKKAFEKLCGYKLCYDVKKREFKVAGHSAALYFTFCYANDLLITNIISMMFWNLILYKFMITNILILIY